MTRETALMIIGGLVVLSPWSGLPLAWLGWVLSVLGLAVLAIAFTLRSRQKTQLPPAPVERVEEPQPRSSHIAFS